MGHIFECKFFSYQGQQKLDCKKNLSTPWTYILYVGKEINLFFLFLAEVWSKVTKGHQLLKRICEYRCKLELYSNQTVHQSVSFSSFLFSGSTAVKCITQPNESLRKPLLSFSSIHLSVTFLEFNDQWNSCWISWEIYKGRQGNIDTEISRDREEQQHTGNLITVSLAPALIALSG